MKTLPQQQAIGFKKNKSKQGYTSRPTWICGKREWTRPTQTKGNN